MPVMPSSSDSFRFGEVVKIVKPDDSFKGRVGSIAAGFNHPQAIKLIKDQYWVELITNEGDKFYRRYLFSDLERFYKGEELS